MVSTTSEEGGGYTLNGPAARKNQSKPNNKNWWDSKVMQKQKVSFIGR